MKNISKFWLRVIVIGLGLAFVANLLKIVPVYMGMKPILLPHYAYGIIGLAALFLGSFMARIFKVAVVFGLFTPLYFLALKSLAATAHITMDPVMVWTLRSLAISLSTATYWYGLRIFKYLGYKTLWTMFAPVRMIRRLRGHLLRRLQVKFNKIPPCPIDLSLSQIDRFGNGDTYEQGRQFEEFVAQIYRVLGYNAKTTTQLRAEGLLPPSIQARGGSGEQGVDVVVPVYDSQSGNEQKIIIQCKHYSKTVGNSAIQEINSALALYQAHKAVVITNNYFTKPAKELAAANGVRIIDREGLVKLMENATQKYYEQYAQRKSQPKTKLVA